MKWRILRGKEWCLKPTVATNKCYVNSATIYDIKGTHVRRSVNKLHRGDIDGYAAQQKTVHYKN